jgi:NAD(P)-dependent dehydrogenase (short-subunit alcohol dehydrogenase family)
MDKSGFDIKGKVVVITGGGGVLGGSMAAHLLENGAKVVVLDRNEEAVENSKENLKEFQDNLDGMACDVLNKDSLHEVATEILTKFGKIDILINAAGGNMPGATIGPDQTIFDLKAEDFRKVVDLNLFGSVLPSMVFGEIMAKNGKGNIINISSMTAQSAITRVVGYSASKAAIDNFTKWLSVELALKFGDGLRVNAIAPGFFIGNQNRALLVKEDGSYTERGNTIIQNTPMKRFGEADELNGAIHFLCSGASSFITGVVLPIDGGFSAFSGV